jgi:hypothetical protein
MAAEPSSLMPMLLKGRHYDSAGTCAGTAAALQPSINRVSGNGNGANRNNEETKPSPAPEHGKIEERQKRDDERFSIEKILSGQFPTDISRELSQFG